MRFMRLPLRDDPWHRSSPGSKAATACHRCERIVLPHSYRTLDPAVRREIVEHAAADGFPLTGILYRPPRGDPDVGRAGDAPARRLLRATTSAPQLAAAGYAFLGAHDALSEPRRRRAPRAARCSTSPARSRGSASAASGRSSCSATRAAARSSRSTSSRRRARRRSGSTRAPSGDRVPLDDTELPMADGLVLLAAHLGEGVFLLDRLDPSVVDEADPIATRSAARHVRSAERLPADGRGPSRYAPEFVAEFRAAQRALRAARSRARSSDRGGGVLPAPARDARRRRAAALARAARVQRPLPAHLPDARRSALPRSRRSIRPSARSARSSPFGRDPIVGNYGEGLRACDERARLALDVVGPVVARGARADAARASRCRRS